MSARRGSDLIRTLKESPRRSKTVKRLFVNCETEGKPRVEWLLSNEYQRKWAEELNQWKKIMYPEKTETSVDVVKYYVLTFKTKHTPTKVEEKKPFKMKRFEGIGSKTDHRRPPDDKAMAFEKEIKTEKLKDVPKNREKPPKNEAK